MEEQKYPMRINKYLAFKRNSSRRKIDELIVQKRVFINDRIAVLGDKVKEGDRVEVRMPEVKRPSPPKIRRRN